MAPESNFSQSLPTDRSLAMQIVEASRHEKSSAAAYPTSSKRGGASKEMAWDSASIASNSSFGSTVGLLKNKFGSSSKSSSPKSSSSKSKSSGSKSAKDKEGDKRRAEQAKILQNQVKPVI